MSMHMYLQIFNTDSKIFGHDGLYRVRYFVMAVWLLAPTTSAALAFVRSSEGYISQGPFCTLPIRPYWYRLALQWTPRYIIWAYIMWVAVRIYLHAGAGFKVFARQHDKASSDGFGVPSSDMNVMDRLKVVKKRQSILSSIGGSQIDNTGMMSSATNATGGDSERRPLSINWPPTMNPLGSDWAKPSNPGNSRRGSHVQTEAAMPSDSLQIPSPQKRYFGSISTLSSVKSTGEASFDGIKSPELAPIDERYSAHGEEGPPIQSGDNPMKKRRRAIQRQLRLLFIYPVVYIIFWTIPFVYHSMNYSDHYAAHPVFPLAVVNTFCQCFLGFADCVVFCWREKPWQQIPGSDGTFLGSFMFWRFNSNLTRWSSTPAPAKIPTLDESRSRWSIRRPGGPSRAISSTSLKPILHKKTFSGKSERAKMQAERAAERLALERKDRESTIPAALIRNSSTTSKKRTEWWERPMSQAFLDTPMQEEDGFNFLTVPESLSASESGPETIREETSHEETRHDDPEHQEHA